MANQLEVNTSLLTETLLTPVEITEEKGASAKRIRQTIKLAFLAPDIVDDILAGKQPQQLTTWREQICESG